MLGYCAPEERGINSKRMLSFLKKLDESGIDIHSVLCLRDDKIITDSYFYPFTKTGLHRMYSVTKSFVSIAIGMLAGEGKLSLDDKITEYFEKYKPAGGFHPYLKETTIRHMLTMRSPHGGTTYDKSSDKDWVKSFFVTTPSHRPGTIFSYDSSASHVLCALAEQLSGMPLLDYLRSKGLSDLGFSDKAYCMTDGDGVSKGASGMMALPLDVLIVAKLIMDGGGGIIPRSYIEEATRKQVPTAHKATFREESYGYGYQFWMIRDGFMMYGLGGQLALVYPDKRIILVVTADTTDRKEGNQFIIDTFRDEVLRYADEEIDRVPKDCIDLLRYKNMRDVKPLKNDAVNGGVIAKKFAQKFDMENNKAGIKEIDINRDEEEGVLGIKYGDGSADSIIFKFGGFCAPAYFGEHGRYMASAEWADSDLLLIKVHLIGECIGKVYIEISFADTGGITVFIRDTDELLSKKYSGFLEGR